MFLQEKNDNMITKNRATPGSNKAIMNTNNNMDMKYLFYCRKSSESDEKQVMSLDSQERELIILAKKLGVRAALKPYRESKSAKTIGRPFFNEMLEKVRSGEANAIMTWHPDRLSRNPVDAARIIALMDEGKLMEVVTPYQAFNNNSMSKYMLGMFMLQAKFDNDHKGENVVEGLQTKAENGWLPYSWTKPGYMWDRLAEKGNKTILNDPIRYPLIKKAWDMMLTGKYNVPKILQVLNNEWNYITLRRKTIGGNPMARSTLYDVFSDPFYYGEYEYPIGSGKWINGKHTPMITKTEFERVQILLGRKGKPRPKTHEFPFTGLVTCGECGAMVTAEEKYQIICPVCKYKFNSNNKDACPKCKTLIEEMVDPKLLHYVYYHCTKRKNPNCTQKSLEVTEWEKQVDNELSKLEISPRFKDWAIKYINEENEREIVDRNTILESQQKSYNEVIKQLDNLVRLKISPNNSDGSLLPDDIYENQMKELQQKKRDLKNRLDGVDARIDNWREQVERTFNFACYARYWFANGDIQTQKDIMMGLGSNLKLFNKIVRIKVQKPLHHIEETKKEVDRINPMFEPNKNADNTIQIEDLWTENPTVLPREDSNLQPYSYRNPLVTKRPGLSYYPVPIGTGHQVYSLYTFNDIPNGTSNLARD